MMKCLVTFTQWYDYTVEAVDPDEAFDKAHELFENDMRRPIARTYYDDYEIEILEESDDEESDDEGDD